MKTITYLLSFQKKNIIITTLFLIVSVLLEAISTQFFPMFVLNVGLNNKNEIILLIIINLILCGMDVIFSPLLTKESELINASICNAFRINNVQLFLKTNHTEKSPENYKASLLVATDHLHSLLDENISQISYRIVYGAGSFIAVLLINPKFFCTILAIGVIVTFIRVRIQPKLNSLYLQRSNSQKNVISSFSVFLENQYIYINPDIAMRALKIFEKIEWAYKRILINTIVTRGGCTGICFI